MNANVWKRSWLRVQENVILWKGNKARCSMNASVCFHFSHDLSVSLYLPLNQSEHQTFFLAVLLVIVKIRKQIIIELAICRSTWLCRIMKPVNKRKINFPPRRRRIEIVRALKWKRERFPFIMWLSVRFLLKSFFRKQIAISFIKSLWIETTFRAWIISI